jgi:transposase
MGKRSRKNSAPRKAKATATPPPSPSRSPDKDVQALRDLVVELIRDGEPDSAIGAVDALLRLIEKLKDENNRQALQIARMVRERYGKRSEKVDPGQLSLFLESLSSEDRSSGEGTGEGEAKAEAAKEADTVRLELEKLREAKLQDRPERTRTGRNKLPGNLPRQTVRLEVAPDLRCCTACGREKALIGVERSEVLEFVPAQLKVIVYEREKRACKSCGDGVVSAKAADKVVDGGRPGPGLLAHLAVSKFLEHTPIHRLAQRFAHLGAPLPASTLGSWVTAVADACEPLYKALCHNALHAHVLGADDTGVRVLDKDHPAGVRKGFLWAYVGYDQTGRPRHAVFDYTPDHQGVHPRRFLAGRRGLVQSDGCNLLDPLFKGPAPPCVDVGCHMHFRRYFKEALDQGDLRAAVPLEWIQRLYSVEALATERGASVAERLALRQEHSTRLIEQLHGWMARQIPRVEPKTALGKALTYGINQWQSLKVFLTDGAIPIDNGEVERRIRPLALGRKNWLFVGSDEGGRRAAILYSLMASCILADLAPEPWLKDVLTRLSQGWPAKRLGELLPDAWKDAHAVAPLKADAA